MNARRLPFRQLLTHAFGAVSLLALSLCIGKSVAASEEITPPFSIQTQDQISWLVKPNGERFFSLGVCCVNQGTSSAEWDPANPGYAAWQHYVDSNTWAGATLSRLKAWGFTT